MERLAAGIDKGNGLEENTGLKRHEHESWSDTPVRYPIGNDDWFRLLMDEQSFLGKR